MFPADRWMIFPSYDVQDRTDHRRLSHLAAHRDSGRSVLRRSEAGRASVGLAVLGGMVITLVAWMHHHVDNIAAKVVAALATAFLLVGGGLETRRGHVPADAGGVMCFSAATALVTACGLAPARVWVRSSLRQHLAHPRRTRAPPHSLRPARAGM